MMRTNDSIKNYKWATDKVAPVDPYQSYKLWLHAEAIRMTIFGIK